MLVRAKFRVMRHVVEWNKTVKIEFAPVGPKHHESEPDGKGGWKSFHTEHPENAAFWSASPSGEASIGGLTSTLAEAYPVGRYVYIDMQETTEPSDWALGSLTMFENGSCIEVTLRRYTPYSSVKINIHNRGAHAPFIDAMIKAHAENKLSTWSVAFTLAPDPERVYDGS